MALLNINKYHTNSVWIHPQNRFLPARWNFNDQNWRIILPTSKLGSRSLICHDHKGSQIFSLFCQNFWPWVDADDKIPGLPCRIEGLLNQRIKICQHYLWKYHTLLIFLLNRQPYFSNHMDKTLKRVFGFKIFTRIKKSFQNLLEKRDFFTVIQIGDEKSWCYQSGLRFVMEFAQRKTWKLYTWWQFLCKLFWTNILCFRSEN